MKHKSLWDPKGMDWDLKFLIRRLSTPSPIGAFKRSRQHKEVIVRNPSPAVSPA